MPYERELLDAASSGEFDEMKKYSSKGASLRAKDDNGNTAFLLVAANGPLSAMKWLVEFHKVSLSERDKMGNTALLWAAYCNNFTGLTWLVEEKKVSVSEKNKEGNTALMLAAGQGYDGVVTYLICRGAEIQAKNNAGNTALDFAKKHNHPKVVESIKCYLRNRSVTEI